MASDLLSIARSGAQTARVALDVTAQNIANASSEGYVRRSVSLQEVAAAGSRTMQTEATLAGVRLDRVVRNADLFRQAEVRRTGADAARSNAEVAGLENIEAAIEQAGVFPAIVEFEGSLQRLLSDPVDPALRTSVIENARTLARTFNVASGSLDTVRDGLHFEASSSVEQVNLLSNELARVNLRLARASDAAGDRNTLLDKRDSLLQQLSEHVDISAAIATDDTVQVRIGGSGGALLVSGGTAASLTMATAGDGTVSFTLDGSAVSPASGALAGQAQALDKLAGLRSDLDAVASSIMTTVNTALAAGVALDGSAGQALFTGSGASDIGLAFEDSALLATAPSGAGANSRDPANLVALRNALSSADPAAAMDAVLFDISSTVAGRKVTRDAIEAIATTARIALQAQAGVDLDQEAVNLVRYQQAFQASGRVMQVASDIFDTLLGIR